ncbi:MAG TPA: hypothetical protein PLA18_16735, partial [Deltaproteobacteria bacterium]|nr:hypothetical protein [Deltaproteobacteria bacterium]
MPSEKKAIIGSNIIWLSKKGHFRALPEKVIILTHWRTWVPGDTQVLEEACVGLPFQVDELLEHVVGGGDPRVRLES